MIQHPTTGEHGPMGGKNCYCQILFNIIITSQSYSCKVVNQRISPHLIKYSFAYSGKLEALQEQIRPF